MRETVLRVLKHFFFVFALLLLGIVLMFSKGIPIWAYFLVIMVAYNAWYLWSQRKRRRARANELTQALEHEDLSPSMHEWLDSATRGLGVIAKKRIAKDIGSHYFDTRAAAIEDGLSETEAELRAIKTLGNPRSARRGFRKVYLTKREETWIRRYYNPSTDRERRAQDMAPVMVGLGVLMLGIFAYGYLVDGEDESGSIMMGLFSIVLGVTTWLQYRWTQQGHPRRAKLVELLGLAFMGFIFMPAILFQSRDSDSSQFFNLVRIALPFFCLYFIVLGVRTLGKLPKELSAEERRFFKRES